jgi:pimeloyl-ACP methyl ester carboxylesterase
LVVLLPALGLDGAMYAPLACALDGSADVSVIDLPGFDEAKRVEDVDDERVLTWALERIAARVRCLGRRPAIMGGLSLGATLTIMLAADLRPSSMLLVAPGGLRASRARREALAFAMQADDPETFARRSLGIDTTTFEASGFRGHFPTTTGHAGAYYPHLVGHVWAAADAAARARLYGALLRAAVHVDLEAQLAKNVVPTDLVWGSDDRVFSTRTQRRYAQILQNRTVHLLAGIGHFPPLEAPERVAEIMMARLLLLARPESGCG